MPQGPLWKIAARLRPGLAAMDTQQQAIHFAPMVGVLLNLPGSLLALGWLIAVTDLGTIRDHGSLFAVLGVVMALMSHQMFKMYLEMENGDLVPATGTLADVVNFSAALIFGPAALWLGVAEQLYVSAREFLQLRRARQNVTWGPLSSLMQGLGRSTLTKLVALAVYRDLGGVYPPAGLAAADWLPAVAAAVVSVALELALTLAMIQQINRVLVAFSPLQSLGHWVQLIALLLGLSAPFPILGALIYAEADAGLYLLFVAGIVLVNFLAYHLSQTVDQSLQRARELAQLESLGEAVIQSPPDLSTLRALLEDHVPRMFPQERVEIHIFEPAAAFGPVFHIHTPPDRPALDGSTWEQLRTAAESHIHLPLKTLPGTTTPAAGIAVRIEADNPGQEGGEKELLIGGISLLRARSVGRASASQAALQSLASQIASAYYRAQSNRETLARQRLAQELSFAGQVQARFLPRTVPDLPGWDLAAGLAPARETSGDFYDFVPLAAGRIGLVVADVADKGTGAALYMALSRTLIRTFALQYPDAPEMALHSANTRILTDAESDQFVTVFYGVLDPASGLLTYANAGHNPAFVLADGHYHALAKTGVPLGMFEDMAWERRTITLGPGDVLLAYSDGVSEAQDAVGAEFGETRLLDAARAHHGDPASALQAAVIAAVQAFVGGAPQFDDITLMVVKRRAE